MAKPVASVGAAVDDWSRDLNKIFGTPPMTAISRAAGVAAVKAGKVAAAAATGGDMRLSGIPKAKLTISLSPVAAAGRVIIMELGATGWSGPGLWGLADKGRGSGKRFSPGMIFPRRRRRDGGRGRAGTGPLPGRAVGPMPDGGLRRYSRYGPQRKKPMAKEKTIAAARATAAVGARKQLQSEIRKVLGKPNRYRLVMR